MAQTATTARLEFSRNPQVENLLTQWRVHWEHIEDYPLAEISDVAGQQVRLQAVAKANPEIVEQYVEQARNGAKFPPLLLRHEPNGRHSMMDGNTRRAMAERLGQDRFPVYVAHVPNLQLANAIAASVNQLGGVRLTESEATRAAMDMLDLKLSDAEIGQAVGRTTAQIRSWRVLHETAEHAKRVGVEPLFDGMPPTQRKMLAKVSLDGPFRELVKFGTGQKITNATMKDVIGDVVAQTSEAEQLQVINDAVAALPVSGPSGSSEVSNPKARRMRMVLPQLLNMLPPEELFEADRAEADEKMWREAGKVVERMLTMYQRRRGGEA